MSFLDEVPSRRRRVKPEDDYEARDAMHTLARAEAHKRDKKLMKRVQRVHVQQGRAIGNPLRGALGGTGRGPQNTPPY